MSTYVIKTEAAAAAREAALRALVERWTAHMHWRKDFDRWRENRLWQEDGQMHRLRTIARACGSLEGKRVLDIGSGMGGFLVAAARNGIVALGLEPSADYCAITRLRAMRYDLPPRVTRGIGESLPFADASFDVVLAQDVLEHVHDAEATLREIRRVLRPDGIALVTVINRFAWRDPHYHLRGINWLPRPAAEWLVERVGRTKRGTRFTDSQRLSAMYYDTFTGFRRRAGRIGFTVDDRRERDLFAADDRTPGIRGRLLDLARRAHVARPLYRRYRFAVPATFEIALRPAVAP